MRIYHPDPDAEPIDVPLAVEAAGGEAIEAYAAEQFAEQGLAWPPVSPPPAPAVEADPAPSPE